MSFVIPTSSSDPLYTQVVTLDGTEYTLKLALNERDQSWYLSVYVDESPVSTSIRLVPDWPLLRKVQDARKPPGVLALIDTTGANDDCGPNDLGTRFVLVYTTQAEVDAFNASLQS